MKPWLCFLFGCVLAQTLPAAEERTTNNAPAAAAAPTNSLSPEILGPYVDLLKNEVEFATAARLFKELAEVHTQRAQSVGSASETEKVRWETGLAEEFSQKAAEMHKRLDEINQQRLAFEDKNKAAGTPQFAVGALAGPSGLNTDEMSYLARLDGRMASLDQEIAALIDSGRGLVASMQTNREPEDIARITDSIQQNSVQTRMLESRRSDLELKKLEFRALRRK